MSFETAALLLAWGGLAILAFAMAGLLRQVKALTRLVTEAAGGTTRKPNISLLGRELPPELLLDDTADGLSGRQLLIFMDEHCPGCAAIEPELDRLSSMLEIRTRLVFRGSAKHGSRERLTILEEMSTAFEKLSIPATPFALRTSIDGRIAQARVIGSPEALRTFVSAGDEG